MAFKIPVRRGEQHWCSKLLDVERFECHRRYHQGEATITALARAKGVSFQAMHRTVHNPQWNAKREKEYNQEKT